MKRFIFVILVSFCTLAFAVEATVVSVSGKVEMQEGRKWLALQKGSKIEKGTVISTGYNSQAVIEFKGTKFTLGSLTRAKIEDLIEEKDKDTANIFIDSGKISAEVNSSDGKRVGFKVRSPIATASVRGTVFTFSAAGTLTVDRGNVSFLPTSASEVSEREQDKGISVKAGETSKANPMKNVCSTPLEEKVIAAAGGLNSTTSLTMTEAVSVSAVTMTPTITVENSTQATKYKDVDIVLVFD